ncbi:MAG: PAS domain S-box-containing protein [Flavobacterium sp.]
MDGEILSVNDSSIRMFGYTKDEFIGKNVSLILEANCVHLNTDNLNNGETDPKEEIFVQEKSMTGIRKNGGKIPIYLIVNDVDASSNKYFLALIRDKSEKIDIDKKLDRTLGILEMTLNESNDSILVTNNAGVLILCNQSFKEMRGIEKALLEGDSVRSHIVGLLRNSKENLKIMQALDSSKINRTEIVELIDDRKIRVSSKFKILGAGEKPESGALAILQDS